MSQKVRPAQANKTVTTAGTRVALADNTVLIRTMVIQADEGNSGSVLVGDSSVSSSVFGVEITAGNSESGQGFR